MQMSSEKEPAKAKEPNRPSVEKLAELACRLGSNNDVSAEDLVNRALKIWDASSAALAIPSQFAQMESFTFEEVANFKLLPAIRESMGTVDSAKGVEKAVARYLDAVIANYNPVMKQRNISDKLLRANRNALTSLRQKLLESKRISKAELKLLAEFQIDMRKGEHKTSAIEIRELLGGADVGTPGMEF